MKSFALAVATIVALSVSSASAADPVSPVKGQVSVNMLSQLGLSGMSDVSDEQGLQVRGKGFSLKINGNQLNLITRNPSGTSAPVVNVQQNSSGGSRHGGSGNIAIINLAPINIGLGGPIGPAP